MYIYTCIYSGCFYALYIFVGYMGIFIVVHVDCLAQLRQIILLLLPKI